MFESITVGGDVMANSKKPKWLKTRRPKEWRSEDRAEQLFNFRPQINQTAQEFTLLHW